MIGGLISIGIFLFIQTIAAVWWASSINTKMDFVVHTKENLDNHITHDLVTFSTKAEVSQALVSHKETVAAALAIADKGIEAMWKQIDMLKSVK